MSEIVYTDDTGAKITDAELRAALGAQGAMLRTRKAEPLVSPVPDIPRNVVWPGGGTMELVRVADQRPLGEIAYEDGAQIEALRELLGLST